MFGSLRRLGSRLLPAVFVVPALSACGGDSDGASVPAAGDTRTDRMVECVVDDPRRDVGAGLDAPGRLEVDRPPAGTASGPCADNRAFRYGSGLHDITGIVANTSGMGWENPQQVFSALHMRQYARAFAIESPCNDRRIMFVSADIGLLRASIRDGVLNAIAADEALSSAYGPDNVMLSATHTHSGPAGYEHGDGANIFHYGYDEQVYDIIVDGIVEAIRRAHANIEAHPGTGTIELASGELLNTNINRSKPAFARNPASERREFLNSRGEEIRVNKRFVQLDLVRDNGSAVGVINWFGVHPTTIGPTRRYVSADNKGFASLGFERIMGTDYTAEPGEDNFVAAFAQADEGDASPNIFIEDFPHPDPRRGGGDTDLASNAIAGTKQLAKALELHGSGTPLVGPVDFRLFHVKFDQVTVDDPTVLDSLNHPDALDAEPKRTCSPALGVSFGAGAEDGPGPGDEGVSCDSDPDLLAAAADDAELLLNTSLRGFPGGWPAETVPPHVLAEAAMCNVDELPPVFGDFSCQAEKPVLLPTGEIILPLQLFRIGNFALLGLPWEVTTMSGRRIRELMLAELAPAGVDTLVIAGLANDYVHYLTTREEYSSQQYEGASTLFGPWTQAAVAQESLKLARAMRSSEPAPDGPAKPPTSPGQPTRPPYVPSDTANPAGAPGTLVADVPTTADPGMTVSAEFVAGHPRNDPKIQSSYVFVERRVAEGEWEVVATDRDPELIFDWRPMSPSPLPFDPPVIGPSTAAAIWAIPRNMPAGIYRLRHEGAAQIAPLLPVEQYSGVSSPFQVTEATAECRR